MPPSHSRPRTPSRTQNPSASDAHRLGRWFAGVRRVGLLARLSPAAWTTLCALLSFTGRDGERRFTLEQLALALGTSREEAESRLQGLARTDWHGAPLLQLEQAPTGEVTGAHLAELAPLHQVTVPVPEPERSPRLEQPMQPEPSKPGSQSSTMSAENSLVEALTAVGLTLAQVARLRERYAPERLRRQLDWLPARQARNPAALLVRAIEGDWEAPQRTGERKENP